jgi:hypothetical protein
MKGTKGTNNQIITEQDEEQTRKVQNRVKISQMDEEETQAQ